MSGLIQSDFKNAWIETSLPSFISAGKVFIASASNTIVKIAASALSFLAPSGENQLNNWANKGFSSIYKARLILPSLFFMSIRLLNPRSEGLEDFENFASKKSEIGSLTQTIAHPLFKRAIEEADDESSPNLRKHIISRGLFLAGIVMVTLTKVAEMGIGLFLFAIGLVCLGQSSTINRLALKYLSSSDIVEEVCAGLRGMINPWTDLGRLGKVWAGKDIWDYRKKLWSLV